MQRAFAGSTANFKAWLAAAAAVSQRRRVRVHVLSLELDQVGDLTSLFEGGQVSIDVTGDVTRTLDLQLNDPTRSIRFEPDQGDFPIYLNRVIRIWLDIWVDGIGWVGCPVFTGPVQSMSRSGVSVSLRCDGMDRLWLNDFDDGRTWPAKTRTTDVIKALLRSTGEVRLGGIPDLPHTLGDKLTVGATDKPGKIAKNLARGLNRVLLPDAMGRAVLRNIQGKPGLTLTDETVGSDLRRDSAPKDFCNKVRVLGPKPEGDKPRIVGHAALRPKIKGSAASLGRNNTPRVFLKVIEAPHIDSQKDANQRANAEIQSQQTAEDTLSIDCLPFPHVEEFDLVAVKGQAGSGRIRIKQATLPLVDGLATFGATRSAPIVNRGRGKGRLGGSGG